MADPATQSPYISSSSSAAGHPEPGVPHPPPGARDCKGAGSPSCADSFVSSSQPVPLFTASQAGAAPASGVDSEAAAEKGSPGTAAPGMEVAAAPAAEGTGSAASPRGSEGSPGVRPQPRSPAGSDSESDGRRAGAERSPAASQRDAAAPFPAEGRQPAARETFSLPPVDAPKEKDSPESPFEVILDRAAFDREYKESLLGDGGAWPARGERELLTQIPEDSVCDFRAKPRAAAAGLPKGPGLSRQSSGTTAALEEVSKCVREMHSFTSELLRWDLVEHGEKLGAAEEPGANAADAASYAVAVRAPMDLVAFERRPPPAAAPKADAGWPAPADGADADSSGESDDTVIEDVPADAASAGEPLAEEARGAGEPPEDERGLADDFETVTAQPESGDSPAAEEKPPGAGVPLPPKRPAEERAPPAAERERPDGGSGESFVAFMRECLKSKGDESPENLASDGSAEPDAAAGSPAAARDLEQEQLTIRALRELGEEPQGQRRGPLPPGEAKPAALESRPLRVPPPPERIPSSGRLPAGAGRDRTAEGPAEHALAELLAALAAHDLIFWRDPKKTGLVFGTTLVLLLSLAAFSVISVVSYLVLALLSVTISFRVYKSVIQAVQKSEEGHPFKAYLDLDVTLSSEAFHNYVNAAMVHVNRALRLVVRLFLVEDLVDSLKLAVVMWLMTYVGAVFNGITLLILAELLIFTLPLVYEKYKTQIDRYVGLAREQTKALVAKIQAKLPGLAKKKPE
ncbi:reticulon-3 [Struthio camelus]|uniref:reticulon-3 n=1 Tax=Struthio camelus TaxID=8801 RepID=UPI0036040FAE